MRPKWIMGAAVLFICDQDQVPDQRSSAKPCWGTLFLTPKATPEKEMEMKGNRKIQSLYYSAAQQTALLDISIYVSVSAFHFGIPWNFIVASAAS